MNGRDPIVEAARRLPRAPTGWRAELRYNGRELAAVVVVSLALGALFVGTLLARTLHSLLLMAAGALACNAYLLVLILRIRRRAAARLRGEFRS